MSGSPGQDGTAPEPRGRTGPPSCAAATKAADAAPEPRPAGAPNPRAAAPQAFPPAAADAPPARRRRPAYRLLRLGLGLLFALSATIGLGIGALAWRVAQGPLDLPLLAQRIEAEVNGSEGPTRLDIGQASIAWAGWRHGTAAPFEIVMRDVRISTGRAATGMVLPEMAVSLSLPTLLRGRLAPRSVTLRGPELRAVRGADGTWLLDLAALAPGAEPASPETEAPGGAPVLAALMLPAAEDSLLGALEQISVSGGQLRVADRQLGREWIIDHIDVALERRPAGGFSGRGAALLRLDAQAAPVRVRLDAMAAPGRIGIGIALPSVSPAALGRAVPLLAPLSALDAPSAFEAEAVFDLGGRLLLIEAGLRSGPGRLTVEGTSIPFASLDAEARLEGEQARLGPARLVLAGPGAPVIGASGAATRAAGRWRGALDARVDRIGFVDLMRIWPASLAPGARAWMAENVTAGTIRNGRWRLEGEAGAALETPHLTGVSGTAEAEGATVHWLRPIPPAEGVAGQASFGLEEITLRVAAGRQAGVQLREGTLRFHGLAIGREALEAALNLAGPIADVMAVLKHPRLHLFDRAAQQPPEVTGQVTEGRVNLALPLLADLPVEALRISAQARAEQVRVPRVLLGQDIERGVFDLSADTEGLRINGNGVVAEVPARLGVEMDFRRGNAQQVVQRESVTARVETRRLPAFGLDLGAAAEGAVALEARRETRRGGAARLTLRGDLREFGYDATRFGWRKARGTAGALDAVIRMQNDVVQAVESFRLEAPEALLRGRATGFRGAVPERLVIQEGRLGASRFQGDLRGPRGAGTGWEVALAGPVIDLRGELADRPATPATPETNAAAGEPFSLDLNFERALLGPERELTAFVTRARMDALGVVREARASARAGSGPFELTITPQSGERRLTLNAADAGALLRAFDVVGTVVGGRLSVAGRYEGNRPGAVLAGTAEMTNYAVRDPTALGKLLQAMTLYGLFEAASGPGLAFNRMIAPFRLSPEALVLEDARAFSASLGLTARGRLDRRAQSVEMEGTIVPAYFFNSLLGNIPLLGRLFSPEEGGGLFAARYSVRGPLSDPTVGMNPLSALTPGFLRGVFGLMERGAAGADPPTPPRYN